MCRPIRFGPVCFLFLALLCVAPPPARAQTPPPNPQAAAHRAHAVQLKAAFDYVGAIAEYQQAYLLDKKVHLEDAALDLNKIGNSYLRISECPRALGSFQQELALERQIGDKAGEATTLGNIGMVYKELSQYAEALDYLQRALPIQMRIRDKSYEATTLGSIGSVYEDLSQCAKALDFYRQALPIQRQVGDKTGEAMTLNNIGSCYFRISQYPRALDFYQQALTLERQVGDKASEAGTLSNIGLIYDGLSQYAKALDFFQQALIIERRIGDKAGEAATLCSIGLVYDNLSQQAKALDLYRQALPIQRRVGDETGEARTLDNIGGIYKDLSQYAKALSFYRQALPIQQQVGDKTGEAVTLCSIGTVYEDLGLYAMALDFYRRVLPIQRQRGDETGEAVTLDNIGTVYEDLSQYTKALDFYQQALPLEQQIGDKAGEAATLNNLMFAWRSLKQPGVAVFYGKQAVNMQQSIRANISTLDKQSQKTYLTANAGAYRTLADLLIRQGRLTEAQQVLRLLKEREFYDFLNPDPNAPPPTMDTVVPTKREADWTAAYDKAAQPLTDLGAQEQTLRVRKDRTPAEDAQLTGLQAQIAQAATALSSVQKQIGAAFSGPRTADDAPPQTTGAGDVQHALTPGTVALYIIVAPDRLNLILITPGTTKPKAYTSPVTADALYQKVLTLRRALTDPDVDPTGPAADLYRLVLGPVQKDLDAAGARAILFSLDDALRYVPPAVLYDPERKQYVAERYQTELITLAGAAPDAPPSGPLSVLGLGVSTSQDGAPALPGVATELAAIVHEPGDTGGLVPGVRLLDAQFTQAALEDGLKTGGYPLVHLASHFALHGTQDTSYLLLGDGSHLSVSELARDPHRFRGVSLLTLSACQTAMEVRGSAGREVEGVAALAQTLGAGSVLASLWPVSDAATPELMTALYGYRQAHPSAPLAEALQAAQLSLLHKPMPASDDKASRGTKAVSGPGERTGLPIFTAPGNARYAHPFYWAPFVLIGNWK